MDPLLLTAAAGTAFSAYNSYMSLKESRKQALETQALRLQEAEMIAERYKANLGITERKGKKEIESMSGGSSQFYGSEKNMSTMADRYSNLVDNLVNLRKEGEFEVSLRQREAALAGEQAAAYNRAVVPTLLGGAIQSGGQFSKAMG